MLTFLAIAVLAAKPSLQIQDVGKYLADHPWDAKKRGLLMVVGPALALPSSTVPSTLQEMKSGGLTVIAPEEMVIIDTQLKDQPDLSRGLPREDKLLYLGSLLNTSQWALAVGRGIGLGDLNSEEQAVFRSILPSTFTFQNSVLGKNNQVESVPGQPQTITLSHDEEAGVRIQFYKEISLGVRMGDNQGFSAIANQTYDTRNPGDPVLYRQDVASEDQTTMFGIQIRKVEPNTIKPSDLNYGATTLDPQVSLLPKTTVADICKSVSQATGLNVLADVRIGKRVVSNFGDSARAGDVLKGLALSVTGTFRKVGNIYELTSDLEGMGTKRMKLALWSWDLEQQTLRRAAQWKQQMSAVGGIRKIGYQVGSPLVPNEAMVKFMQKGGDQGNDWMPASELSPLWHEKLEKGKDQFGSQSIRMDTAEPYEAVFWCFVLPDGRSLNWENEVGQMNEFLPSRAAPRDRTSKSVVKPISLASTSVMAYQTEDALVAAQLPKAAKDHGFKELWLHTWNPDCISAALESGGALDVPIRIILQPWEARPDSKGPTADVSILGTTLPQSTALQAQTDWWKDSEPSWGISRFPATETLALNDSRLTGNWQHLISLAKTPGLAGAVLLDTLPPGYEATVSQSRYLPIEMTVILDMGYTPELRAKFLAENLVDPLDFIDTRLDFRTLDLSTIAFGDPKYFGFGSLDSSQPQGSMMKWIKLLADGNLKATHDFASQVPGSILFQARNISQDLPRLGQYLIAPWQSSADFPGNAQGPFELGSVPEGGYSLIQFGWPFEPAVGSRMFDNLTRHYKQAKGKTAIDLSSVPVGELGKVLDTWFKP